MAEPLKYRPKDCFRSGEAEIKVGKNRKTKVAIKRIKTAITQPTVHIMNIN